MQTWRLDIVHFLNSGSDECAGGVKLKVCALHSGKVEGKIIPFTSVKLEECEKVKSIRQENNLKHKDVQLPNSVDGFTGYHLVKIRIMMKKFVLEG